MQVRLVLEYCDKGSLHEALEQGSFLGPSEWCCSRFFLTHPSLPRSARSGRSLTCLFFPICLNAGGLCFGAILETAIDIANAMVHMHAASILHSDLKVGS